MPVPPPLDPEAAAALAERLALARDEVRTASGELLEHYVDVGDGATQLAVETLADHAADALRALDDALGTAPGPCLRPPATPPLRGAPAPARARGLGSGVVSDPLVRGDAGPCSRVGGAMRSDAARLLHRQQTLERSLRELRGARGPAGQALRRPLEEQAGCSAGGGRPRPCGCRAAALRDRPGPGPRAVPAGRGVRARRRAGLEGTRVVEAWGPTSAPEAAGDGAPCCPSARPASTGPPRWSAGPGPRSQRAAAELVPAFTGVGRPPCAAHRALAPPPA